MAKQTVNIGTTANDRTGDNLRTAFNKINDNFSELYTALGLDELPLNLGAFEFTGSTITTTDSSAVTIDQATTVTSDLTVSGDVLPSTANGGDLGSLAKPWRSLYVSSSTVYFGEVPVSLDENNNLLVDGVAIADAGTAAWANITGKPTFATVATSGAYADLSGRPTIPTLASQLTNDSGFITAAEIAGGTLTIDVNNTGDLQGSVFGDDSTLLVDATNSTIPYSVLSGAPSFGNWSFNSNTLSENSTGNAVIQSSDFAGSKLILQTRGPTDKQWIFDQDGDLTLPGGSVIADTSRGEGNTAIVSAPDGRITLVGIDETNFGRAFVTLLGDSNEVRIATWSDDSSQEWVFDGDGNLNLPTNVPGVIQSENEINIRVNLTDSTTRNWTFTEGGDLRFPNGTTQTTAYTGGGNVSVNTDFTVTVDSGDSSPQVWSFDTGGILNLPNGQTIEATDPNQLQIGSPDAALTLDSNRDAAILTAKKSFDRLFVNGGIDDENINGELGDGIDIIYYDDAGQGIIEIYFLPNAGAGYLRELLRRLNRRLDYDDQDFVYDYRNIRIIVNPNNEPVTVNVTNVRANYDDYEEHESNGNPPIYYIEVDRIPDPDPTVIYEIRILYDYYNAVGLDRVRDIYGISTDNDDIDFVSGRDIELRSGDDIIMTANSNLRLRLNRYENQYSDEGIEIVTRSESPDQENLWTFRFDGDLELPSSGGIVSENDINIRVNLTDSTTRIWRFGEDGNTDFPGTIDSPSIITQGIRGNEGTAEGNGNSLLVAAGSGSLSGGNLSIQAGIANSGTGGNISVLAGTSQSGAGGNLSVSAGFAFNGQGGDVTISGGVAAGSAGSGSGGDAFIYGGTGGSAGDGGDIQIIAGSSSSYNGGTVVISSGSSSNQGGDLTLLGGAGSGGVGGDLIIEAGLGLSDPGDVIIRGGVGEEYRGDLIVEAGHVVIGSEGDVSININLSDSTQRTWRFGEDGELVTPGSITTTGINSTGEFTINVEEFGEEGTYTFGAVNLQLPGWSTPDLILGRANDEVVLWTPGEGRSLSLQSDNGSHTWNFGEDGDLTFPDSTVQTTAWTGTADVAKNIESESDVNIRVNLTDSTQHIWRFGEDGDLTIPGRIEGPSELILSGTVYIGNDIGPGGIPAMPSSMITVGGSDPLVISRANGTNNPSWSFKNSGALRFPNSTEQTTAYIANNVVQVSTTDAFSGDAIIYNLGVYQFKMTSGHLQMRLIAPAGIVQNAGVSTVENINEIISGNNTGLLTLDDSTWTTVTGKPTAAGGDTIVATVVSTQEGKMYRVTAFRSFVNSSHMVSRETLRG